VIFLVPGGDKEADAVASCAEYAGKACGVPAADMLRGDHVTRQNISRCCRHWDGKLVCFWGHGAKNGNALLDMHRRRVIGVGNIAGLAGTAGILAVACHSAGGLGPHAVEKKGLKFFMGFIGKFWFVMRNNLTAKYPLFSEPLKTYKKNRNRVELGRHAVADLLGFVMDGVQRAGCSSLQDVYRLVTDEGGNVSWDLMDALPPLSKDGVVMAFAGSQNLMNFRVIPELPPPTES
jgi:hypothetical protein